MVRELNAQHCNVLVTSRPEMLVQRELRTLRPEKLDAEQHTAECAADVRAFLRVVLAPVVDAARLEAAVATVERKAECNFLYLHWARQRIEEDRALDVESLPTGLASNSRGLKVLRSIPASHVFWCTSGACCASACG